MISLIRYDEFAKGMGFPSLKDFVQPERYPGQDDIVKYLYSAEGGMVSMTRLIDVFTGEPINQEVVFMNDGVYRWISTLAYYVNHYNLRLPKEFEDHVLNKVQSNS